jgi:mannosyltransferase
MLSEDFPEVVIPNLKKRFSGITSTILQVLPGQSKQIQIRLLGHPLPLEIKRLSFWKLFRQSGRLHPGGYPVIFHARRNDDMILGYFLKVVLRRKLHLVFTSVAQREHSWITRFLYWRMDTLLTTSDRSASYLKRTPDKIIPHGTDTSRYHPSSDRAGEWAESGLPGKYGVGVFGRVRPNKGIGEFVRALCEVLPDYPDFTAVICGEVTPKHQHFVSELKQIIEDKGLTDRFVWLGKRPFDEIPVWFRRMTIVAAVSHTEGFGLTCLEAMSSGVPVVATQTGGFEMVIREGVDGHIIPCRDAGALAKVFSSLFADVPRLEKMGESARARIEDKFTVEREVSQLLGVYRGIQESYKS